MGSAKKRATSPAKGNPGKRPKLSLVQVTDTIIETLAKAKKQETKDEEHVEGKKKPRYNTPRDLIAWKRDTNRFIASIRKSERMKNSQIDWDDVINIMGKGSRGGAEQHMDKLVKENFGSIIRGPYKTKKRARVDSAGPSTAGDLEDNDDKKDDDYHPKAASPSKGKKSKTVKPSPKKKTAAVKKTPVPKSESPATVVPKTERTAAVASELSKSAIPNPERLPHLHDISPAHEAVILPSILYPPVHPSISSNRYNNGMVITDCDALFSAPAMSWNENMMPPTTRAPPSTTTMATAPSPAPAFGGPLVQAALTPWAIDLPLAAGGDDTEALPPPPAPTTFGTDSSVVFGGEEGAFEAAFREMGVVKEEVDFDMFLDY